MISPSARHPIAFDRDATFLVTSDGPLVLVHDGKTEAPMFVHRMTGDVVGLAADVTSVTAIDANGRVHVVDAKGALVREADTGGPSHGGTAAKGRVAVLGASVALIDASGAITRLDVAGASCAAFSDGTTLLVGTEGGELCSFDVTTGAKIATASLPGPAYGVAWSPRGHFVVTTKGGLGKVSSDLARVEPLCGTGDVNIGPVACSADGLFAACRVEDGRVIIFEVAKNRPAGMITWERGTGGVAFGPEGWLAVALDLGDGNKIDLDTGAVCRTDPHEGRVRNTWLLLADVKTERVAEARAAARPSARPPSAVTPSFDPMMPRTAPASRRNGLLVAIGLALGVIVAVLYLSRL